MAETATIQTIDTLVVKRCGECGVSFALPRQLNEENKKTGADWYCPNGHCRVYRETEADRLRKELARKQAWLDQAKASTRYQREQRERAERQLSATRGVITRIKNRVGKGVCPCCNRSFTDLRRHMDSKHPDYAKESPDAKA